MECPEGREETRKKTPPEKRPTPPKRYAPIPMNRLLFGDNLKVLRESVADASVDLVYLDPPFNSNASYNVLFEDKAGAASAAQTLAFKDTWEWGPEAIEAYDELMMRPETPPKLADLMRALRGFLTSGVAGHGNGMMAYLTMMALRLVELHRVLKPTGSLYLHCDPTASHYLKLMLDAIFGAGQFQNEIVWFYKKWSASTTRFLRNHDVIFFYSKEKEHKFNVQYVELSESTKKRFKGQRQDFADEARTRKIMTDEESAGSYMPDVWPMSLLAANSHEKLGYPTQKPEALLERILLASSDEGDTVLDPFCGCGTTIAVAERLNRRWIGIDVTYLAVDLIERRLLDAHTPANAPKLSALPVQTRRRALKRLWAGETDVATDGLTFIVKGLAPFEVKGDPTTVEDARRLFAEDPYQFEWWCVAMVGAAGKDYKRGADRGIDGTITFRDGAEHPRILVSVKGGKLTRNMVTSLLGDVENQGFVAGVLVSLEDPTAPMRTEAAEAGTFPTVAYGTFPKLQLLTVADLFAGRTVRYPLQAAATFRTATRAKPAPTPQTGLDL